MNDWRTNPSTKRQHSKMDSLGIQYSANISKGEASYLISKATEASDHQIEILKFFRIKNAAKLSQFDATNTIEDLFSDVKQKDRWENRRSTRDQKEILSFFKMPIKPGLKHKEADKLISILMSNDKYQEQWYEHEDAIEERRDWLEFERDNFNDAASDCGCKKLTKKMFSTLINALESKGMAPQEIEDLDYDVFFSHAKHEFPEIQKNT